MKIDWVYSSWPTSSVKSFVWGLDIKITVFLKKIERREIEKIDIIAEGSDFVQPTIPKIDGHYDHWLILVENRL